MINYQFVKSAFIHLILGEDDYLVEQAARKIIESSVEASLRKEAVEIISGEASNEADQRMSISKCVQSILTPPFFTPMKLTWWRGVTFLPGATKAALSEGTKTGLAQFVEQIQKYSFSARQILLITATKALKTSAFMKAFKELAQITEFSSSAKIKDRLSEARMRLPELAQMEGLTFASGVDLAFLLKVGTSSRRIASELAKLRTYLGTERTQVTHADVEEVCSLFVEGTEPWDVTNAVGQRNETLLLQVLSKYDNTNSVAVMLSSICEKFFRDLIAVRAALDQKFLMPTGAWSRALSPEVTEDLKALGLDPSARNSWALPRQIQHANNFTLRELRVARFLILQVREKLTSSSATASLLVQELLRIIARPVRRQTPCRQ